ncbi:hypothetical protein SAMN04487786_0197 [Paenisporosarcina quisquiliarum]|nr:hypothetical protein SAMN04487786_0197 [Paenisporosarcina quisquiliarum]
MDVQLIICDSTIFDKSHSIENVRNSVSVDTFPSIINLSTFVKIIDMPKNETIDFDLVVFDSKNNILNNASTFVLRNYREENEVPGIDFDLKVQLVILEKGNIYFKAYINRKEATSCPLYIKKDG